MFAVVWQHLPTPIPPTPLLAPPIPLFLPRLLPLHPMPLPYPLPTPAPIGLPTLVGEILVGVALGPWPQHVDHTVLLGGGGTHQHSPPF